MSGAASPTSTWVSLSVGDGERLSRVLTLAEAGERDRLDEELGSLLTQRTRLGPAVGSLRRTEPVVRLFVERRLSDGHAYSAGCLLSVAEVRRSRVSTLPLELRRLLARIQLEVDRDRPPR